MVANFINKNSSLVLAMASMRWCLGLLLALPQLGHAGINIAPYSSVRSTPYTGAGISYLTDGKVGSPADNTLMMSAPLPITIGNVMPLQYEFAFPKRSPITRVRLFQHMTQGRMPASGYAIELDTSGDGNYDKLIANERNGRGGEWFAYDISPSVEAYGLRFRTTSFPNVSGPNYGSPALGEFEIYADASLPSRAIGALPSAPYLEADPAKTVKITVENNTLPRSAQFQRGLFGSMWLYWPADAKYSEVENLRNIDLLKSLRINRYWLYPGVYVSRESKLITYPKDADYLYFINRQINGGSLTTSSKSLRIAPFPSNVVPGYPENMLGKFVAQMHKNNIEVIVNELLLPYGLGGWDFPRVMNQDIYPDVLSSSFVHDTSTSFYREYMRAGADGLALGGDEFFLYSSDEYSGDVQRGMAPICKDRNGSIRDICKPTRSELFKARYGVGYPSKRQPFTPLVAKRIVFDYEQLASLFADYADMMKTINPNAVVTSLFRAGETNRPSYGIAYDIMGTKGSVSEMSSNPYWSHNSFLGHYYFANETKKLIGASKDRKAAITLQATPNFDKNGYQEPIMVYGPAFSSLMHGARGINFYKQDYLFAGGKNDAGPWVRKFFNLTAYLEQGGLLDYQVPRKVALLYSRASEDWWLMSHPQNSAVAAEGIISHNAVMEALFKNGIPFDLYYLDQPASLEKLGQYSVIVIPFAYSIQMESIVRIRQAIDHGAKVLVLQHNGEVNEYAEHYTTPLLSSLPGVEHVAVDLTRSNYELFSKQFIPFLVDRLGSNLPLTFNSGGQDVECSMLSHQASQMVFCLNWEQRHAEIDLGLNLIDGYYSVSVINLDEEAPASINGKSKIAAEELKHFRLVLSPGEARILWVAPAHGDGS